MPGLLEEIAARSGLNGRLQALLDHSGDRDLALLHLERFSIAQPAAFARLTAQPGALQDLLAVFGHSRFLAESILNEPAWLEELAISGDVQRSLSADEMAARFRADLGSNPCDAPAIARFRRRGLLRILLRDVEGLASLAETAAEISALADAVLDVTYQRLRAELEAKHGAPRLENGEPCGFSVLGLGKLGGKELNYSSDIDLMFVFEGSGETDGPSPVSNKEFFQKLAVLYTDLLGTYTAAGMGYRVDLRLRPDGKLGEVAISLDGAKSYYQTRGRDWELQMLIKARVAAGEHGPGQQLLDFVEPLIYSSTLDFSAVEAVSATRLRLNEKLATRRTGAELDIKLARGGIRDIEFLVQCLQRLHGGREPWVRHGGTMLALSRLQQKNLLSDRESSQLLTAYQFLRHLEHRLQFDQDQQTHTLPPPGEAMDRLARRMVSASAAGVMMGAEPTGERLLQRINSHLEEVAQIYERVIHAQKPMYYFTAPAAAPIADEIAEPPEARSNLVRFLDQRAPQLAQRLSAGRLHYGWRNFEHFLERILTQPHRLARLEEDSVLCGFLFDIFENSPWLSEQLVRAPELLDELVAMRVQPQSGRAAANRYSETVADLTDPVDLRRFYRREMFRIQAESVCLRLPIFTTLERTSGLADAAILAAYNMAVWQTTGAHPSAVEGYHPHDQLMVVTLGRLGMREFDLASDADLVFVLTDEDAAEKPFWTRVAGRLIDILSAYTGEGVVFSVDTRLRPSGNDGDLVQTETAFKEYFERAAEAWEGIAYMKSRAVAGDTERATQFLNELQDIDWRRYGQSGRSKKELKQMRLRLEKEQGPENPLKAGHGGYYDIDFALMYLRLKAAGMFFKVLNTPERIDVCERMGHLERNDARFLGDGATLFRAVDHSMRVITGQALGQLPVSPLMLAQLTELVTRWTPEHLHDQPIADELAQIQSRTRDYFERLFS